MTIGQRIRERRHEQGLTLKELAERTGLSLTYLSDVERDRTRPSMKTLVRISEKLGSTATDLMRSVEGLGELTEASLPAGLKDLINDPDWAPHVDEEWVRTLMRVDYRGKRPQTKQDWIHLFLTLQSVLDEHRS
jgi:transcriptional regulator with XRE-family HTH domain